MKDKKKAPPIREERWPLKPTNTSVGVYLTEKDADKRVNWVFVRMLEGLSKMLEVWGDMECKGGGCVDPHEALFHCRACTFNGIRKHVDQAIARWKSKDQVEVHGLCKGCDMYVPKGFYECNGSGSHAMAPK